MRPAGSSRVALIITFVFGLALSACGGGGGGSTPVPGGGNGGGGGATPTPTPTGRATSTPTPKSTPTATPTATPTPITSQGTTMLPDTAGRFGLIQVLDDYYSGAPAMSATQISNEAPHYDSVWGAFFPSTWRGANGRIILSRYFVTAEDDKLVSGHDLSWWQSNHPDWILYACKSDGTPTKDLVTSGAHFGDVPLAFYLPQVQQYQMQLMIPYLQANGYQALAVDNTDLFNILTGGNSDFGQTNNSSEYGCGTYDSSGNFVRRYGAANQTYDTHDPQYVSDLLNWMSETKTALHAAGLKVLANHPYIEESAGNAQAQQLFSDTDGVLDEPGYTHYGSPYTGGNLDTTLQWTEYLQQHGIAALITDYWECSSCTNNPSALTAQQVDFSLATYALGNEGGEDVYISPNAGSNYSYRPEYANTYGSPCGAYTQVSPYVYVRRFSGGLAIVNASGSSYSYTLPSGHVYNDIEGRSVSSPLSVGSTDGYMLLTSGNGCS